MAKLSAVAVLRMRCFGPCCLAEADVEAAEAEAGAAVDLPVVADLVGSEAEVLAVVALAVVGKPRNKD